MRFIPHYYPSYQLLAFSTSEENLSFLKKGFESLSDVLSKQNDDCMIEVDIWNAEGITIAIAPRKNSLLQPLSFHYNAGGSALMLSKVGENFSYLRLEHLCTGQNYIIYRDPHIFKKE